MRIPERKELLELYSEEVEKFLIYLEDYLETDDETSRLNHIIHGKISEFFSILLNNTIDKSVLVKLKRTKKQLIAYCLELLSIQWCEDIVVLMKKISNKKHCWKIVVNKKLEYSEDFIEEIFD